MLGAIKSSVDILRAKIRVQGWQARFQRFGGNSERAIKLSHEALKQLDQPGLERENYIDDWAFLLLELGHQNQYTNRESAEKCYQESLNLFHTIGDDWGAANALSGLAEVGTHTGRPADSIDFYDKSLTLYRALGDPRGMANALNGSGHARIRCGRFQEGEKFVRESIKVFEALGDRAGMARGFLHLSRPLFWQGQFAGIPEMVDQGLPILKNLGLQYDTAFMLAAGIGSNTMLGWYGRSSNYINEMIQLCQTIDYPRMDAYTYYFQGWMALVNKEYEKAILNFQQSVKIFGEVEMRDEQAASMAWFACAKINLGAYRPACRLLCEALQIAVELEAVWSASWTLPVVALYLARQGKLEKALEVQVLAKRQPIPANSIWMADVAMNETDALVAALPEEVAAEARKRGEEAELFGFTAELLEFLKTAEPLNIQPNPI